MTIAFDGRVIAGITVFVAVTKAGSYARAGEHIGLSRSGIGKSIARLEDRIGMRLFDRNSRTLKLTDQGRLFLEEVAPLLDELGRIATPSTPEDIRGRLRVTKDAAFGTFLLIPALPKFLADYPQVKVDVVVRDRIENLASEGFDVAIRFGEPEARGLKDMPEIGMTRARTGIIRRSAIGIGLTGLAAVALGKATHAARLGALGDRPPNDNFAFTKTDEAALHVDDMSLPPRARELIRIGEVGIAREDSAALRAFFHPHFRFHGPAGAQADREQLWAYFAACRAAFDDFTVTRQSLMSDGVDHMAARTRFAGIFVRTFKGLSIGPLEPNDKRFEYRLLNQFRYASNGQLIEEWAQYDTQNFVDQLQR